MSTTEMELVDIRTGEQVSFQTSWKGAALRGLEARKEREAIVSQILKDGLDFGTIPGCGDKPALLKPGAEKIADALSLYPDYEELDKIQDFTNHLWFYRYRCRLRQRGTDTVMSTGIGSCNSDAAKYKFRDGQRLCPECGKPTIIKGKAEYGGGFLCFWKKGGCGEKFLDDDKRITEQQTGQIENPDIASLVNTVDKMAQKSAFVAACLNLGFSEQFTQDIDDNPGAFSSNQPEGARREPERPRETPEQAAIRELMAQAEKLLPPTSKKLAELRSITDPNELGRKVQILVDLKKKKNQAIDPEAAEKDAKITKIREALSAGNQDEQKYMSDHYGILLNECSLDQLVEILEDVVPF